MIELVERARQLLFLEIAVSLDQPLAWCWCSERDLHAGLLVRGFGGQSSRRVINVDEKFYGVYPRLLARCYLQNY